MTEFMISYRPGDARNDNADDDIMDASRVGATVPAQTARKQEGWSLLLELFPGRTTLEHAQQVFTILCYLIVILLQYVQTFYIG